MDEKFARLSGFMFRRSPLLSGGGVMDLNSMDKLALVTGKYRGHRLPCARGLLREGARVIVNGRTQRR